MQHVPEWVLPARVQAVYANAVRQVVWVDRASAEQRPYLQCPFCVVVPSVPDASQSIPLGIYVRMSQGQTGGWLTRESSFQLSSRLHLLAALLPFFCIYRQRGSALLFPRRP